MKKKKIRELLDKDLEQMGQYSLGIDRKFGEEQIHRFRVQAKKTRALLRLISLQEKDEDIAFSRRVKSLYQLAGQIRDYQLMLRETGDDIPELSGWLRNNIGVAQYNWQEHFSQKAIQHFAGKIGGRVVSVDIATAERFFRKRCKTIRETMKDIAAEDETLHDMRKLLKDMYYIAAFCEEHWPAAHERLQRYPLADLKPLSAMAGSYNDHTNRIRFLYAFASVQPSAAVSTAFTQLLRSHIAERQQARTALVAALQQFAARLPKR